MAALTDNEFWMKLSTAIHHYGAKALLCEFNKVMPADRKDLYQEIQKLLNMTSGKGAKKLVKSFNKGEFGLMQSANGETDSSTFDVSLICKIIGVCRDVNFSYQNNQFVYPTGIPFDVNTPPSLTHANSGDCVQLLKDLRNAILHAPAGNMKESQFKSLWKFMSDLFRCIGYNAVDMEELEKASVISENFKAALMKSLKDLETQGNQHGVDISIIKSMKCKYDIDVPDIKSKISKHDVNIQENKAYICKHDVDIETLKSIIRRQDVELQHIKRTNEDDQSNSKNNDHVHWDVGKIIYRLLRQQLCKF